MLKHLFDWLNANGIDVPGDNLFQFITSRMMLAMVLSLVISTIFGKKIILYLQSKQIGESVRDLGLAGEQQKKGTPTMGGIIIIISILIPTLLLADISKVYIMLMLFATVWMGFIGFVDDYLKLRAKRIAQQKGITYKKGDNDGLAGWFKYWDKLFWVLLWLQHYFLMKRSVCIVSLMELQCQPPQKLKKYCSTEKKRPWLKLMSRSLQSLL